MNIQAKTYIPQSKKEAIIQHFDFKRQLDDTEEALAKDDDKFIETTKFLEGLPPTTQTITQGQEGEATFYVSNRFQQTPAGPKEEELFLSRVRDDAGSDAIEVSRSFDHDSDVTTPNITESYVIDGSGNIVVLEDGKSV